MESVEREESDSSSVEFEDHINISLLPDKKHGRKKKFRGPKFVLKLREMFGGKAAIYSVVSALLLVSVLLLAVFARPSSSIDETVNKNSKKNSRYDFEQARDASVSDQETKDQDPHSIRLPRHVLPIEYLVYLHPNLTTFNFSGKVDVRLECKEAANNITLHIGKKINYFNVAVGLLNNKNSIESILEVTGTSRLPGEMVSIALGSELQPGKEYLVVIEFDSELSRGLSGFYLSKYTTTSGETR